MADKIFALLLTIFFFAYFFYLLALAFSPSFRVKNKEWIQAISPKVQSIFKYMVDKYASIYIFLYDVLFAPIFFVLALALVFEDIYPILLKNPAEVLDKFQGMLAGEPMNYLPYIIFIIAFFIWFTGFLIKRIKENEERAEQRAFNESLITKQENINTELMNTINSLISEIRQDRNERNNNKRD